MRPVHWVLVGLGSALVLACGLCGVVGVIGATTDPAPSTSVVAATGTPSAPATESPSESPFPSLTEPTAAPLVGDDVTGSESGADTDVDRQTRAAAPSTRRADPQLTTSAPRTSAPRTSAPRTSAPKPAAPRPPKSSAPASVYYKNCTAVRAAGAAPIHAGEPGYAKHLDRDGDGVGCE